ncbi:hypothetical protein SBBP2_1550016 [Burkholderiales bacterium]|jgi:hypothetical protein|nr:hypothetical protein SBBP2_1550016 [Burkholderiales bacterium]
MIDAVDWERDQFSPSNRSGKQPLAIFKPAVVPLKLASMSEDEVPDSGGRTGAAANIEHAAPAQSFVEAPTRRRPVIA